MSTNFKTFISNDYILNSIDCTYLLSYDQLNEFNKYPLTNKYIYVENFYSESKKFGSYKLIMEIFGHANLNNYNNILIFHEDFKFRKCFNNEKIQKKLNDSISNISNTNYIYLLDCLPIIQIPLLNENICLFALYENGVVYPRKFREKHSGLDIKNNINNYIHFWSHYLKLNSIIKYTFKRPIIYKLYDNNLLKILQLDKKPEPGYKTFYLLSQIIGCTLVFLLIKILYYLFKNNNPTIESNNNKEEAILLIIHD